MNTIFETQLSFGAFCADNYASDSIVADEHVAQLYGLHGDNVFCLPQGEQAKSLSTVQRLLQWFLQRKLGQGNRIVAVGGGSVGDTVGFACAVYKRGVLRLLHVPTTLIAMVDSAIGGKTALDLDGVKNAVGCYFFADTLVDTAFLRTLDDVQMRSGLGEVLKYRMLCADVDNLCRTHPFNSNEVIASCARYKLQVCTQDPFCQNVRNQLNFGHTVGHAMELSLGLTHGEAVANGICYETQLACALGLVSKQYAQQWTDVVRSQFEVRPLTQDSIEFALQDKKNNGGNVGFALPPTFQTVQLSPQTVQKILL